MSEGNGRVAGKVAVITGASSGIGRASFELFAREGAKVVATARTESKLQETLDAVKAAGGEAIIVPADLEDDATPDKVIQAAIDEYGQIDILVCNAGVGWKYGEENPGTMAAVHEASVENWRDVIGGVDLEGYFTMIHAALPHMLEREKGSIVSVASMAGLTGLYDAHAYTAAKGAIINLTRSMGITYAKQGVRANCICPGFIDTPMIEPAIEAFRDEATKYVMVPMGRAGTPEEMAYAILYLGSDESSYCTGTALLADGGSTSRSFPMG
jgi:meso-butanediol dehydrogenase / (S,S)-butanediol dehydrogenase / diacetyl reductase